jgi:hypothetical protein
VKGLAVLGIEERFKVTGLEPDQASWKMCFQLYLQAFREPKSAPDQKKLARILKKPLNPDVEKDLFDYDSFLRGLGRMSLNIESHGGLYTLHSHINHSCTPNVSVRHLEQRTALSRITLVARTIIPAGEELFVSYVDPDAGVKERRRELLGWGFGECRCKRCVEEAKSTKDIASEIGPTDLDAHEGLEKELKAGLGIL